MVEYWPSTRIARLSLSPSKNTKSMTEITNMIRIIDASLRAASTSMAFPFSLLPGFARS